MIEELKKEQKLDMDRALAWWRGASEQDKVLVWKEIQRHHQDPVTEVLARFAQIGFTQVSLQANSREN